MLKKKANLRSPLLAFEAQALCLHSYYSILAERTGLEPATPGVTGRYSNQLNYRSEKHFTAYPVVGAERLELPT